MQPSSTPGGAGPRPLRRLHSDSRARRDRLVERARSIQKRLPPRPATA
jgi:hypothetical protein